MYIKAKYRMSSSLKAKLRKMQPIFGFNEFGAIVYYRSYSRRIEEDGRVLGQEDWADTVIRVMEGVMSIRLDWYMRNHIEWDISEEFVDKMAVSLFRMEWLPPGRGLWAMGTDLIRDRGAMALYNCAFTQIGQNWIDDLCWLKDCLMYGVGVGFEGVETGLRLKEPDGGYHYKIPDSREGWVESLRLLLNAFSTGDRMPVFDYSDIRPYGSPIRSFGGTASGPEPLQKMYEEIQHLCYRYCHEGYSETKFKADLANLIGVCVVAGNVRRSAEIGLGSINDEDFVNLKNYELNPYRAGWGWMSNNSVKLQGDDFLQMDRIAQLNIRGYDMGVLNMHNIPYARIGKPCDRFDKAIGLNPCGEILLESREVCNVAETLPTRCVDTNAWLRACEYATFYCSTVTLLPTHQPSTNAIVNRNRRIGISIIDFSGWKEKTSVSEITTALRAGYKVVKSTNEMLAAEAGIPPSIRITTMKPGGTVPKMAGRSPGMSNPTFKYTLRRITVQVGTPIDHVMIEAGIPYEDSVYTPNTHVFEYPIEQGPAPPATEVSLWEQAFNLILLQREWADNAVSNTLYFKPKWKQVPEAVYLHMQRKMHDVKIQDGRYFVFDPNHEEDILEEVLSNTIPLVKSISVLPHSDVGIFPQMPEEGISKDEYERRLEAIRPIDWSKFSNSDGMDEQFCVGDRCTIQGK